MICTGRKFGPSRCNNTGTRPIATRGVSTHPKTSCSRTANIGRAPTAIIEPNSASRRRSHFRRHVFFKQSVQRIVQRSGQESGKGRSAKLVHPCACCDRQSPATRQAARHPSQARSAREDVFAQTAADRANRRPTRPPRKILPLADAAPRLTLLPLAGHQPVRPGLHAGAGRDTRRGRADNALPGLVKYHFAFPPDRLRK